ncbi:MAG: DUF4282 domain-containing protein, partial [Sulfurimonadaceae bacterium]|nr:DUF4282 domain-containing protein [Sulfurimonadaceae bacterium]
FVTWYFSIWLIRKYEMISIASKKATESFWKLLSTKQKSGFILFLIIAFLLMELFWRMLFEFLIAYMQMRDAIVGVSI